MDISSFFFVGVAGVGMSALAQYLAGKGHSVSGSDRQFAELPVPRVRTQLEEAGVKCFAQDGSGVIQGLTAVVVSTAIEAGNPDVDKARLLNIPVMHRSEMLALISASCKTIAVSGTSGKSTVTGMIWHILQQAGWQPSILSGAGLTELEAQGKIGNAVAGAGDWLVAEADESDGTLVRYSPRIGLILNLDKDHKEISELQGVFQTFAQNIANVGGDLIVNDAHPLARAFSTGQRNDFGYEGSCWVQGLDFRPVGTGIFFRARHKGELVRVELPLPGQHNMENALAAIAAALKVGVPLRTCAEALATWKGIHRRHQILGTHNGITLVDDFAHNPAKIAASIRSCQSFTSGRVLAWFQPHGFGPTRFLRHDLVQEIARALRPAEDGRGNDQMWFSRIYYAGGTAVQDICASDLADDLLEIRTEAHYVADRDACADAMVGEAQPGDTIVLMGARDPSLAQYAQSVWEKVKRKRMGNE